MIANRALEIMGHKKGEYQFCSPNDHVNCAQSTNDAYPSAFRYAFIRMNRNLEKALKDLIAAFQAKGEEFKDVIKMGRTQLQDAVPMTSGQEFHAYATNLGEEVLNIERNVNLLYEINMGGTAIGIVTALNPIISYKASTKVAKEALETNRSVYDIVLEHGILTKEQLDNALDPKNMIG